MTNYHTNSLHAQQEDREGFTADDTCARPCSITEFTADGSELRRTPSSRACTVWLARTTSPRSNTRTASRYHGNSPNDAPRALSVTFALTRLLRSARSTRLPGLS